MSKKIKQWVVRTSDEDDQALRSFANERGTSPAEVIRRAVRALLAPAQPDEKPGVVAKPRGVEVSTTSELGPDTLGAPSRSLAR